LHYPVADSGNTQWPFLPVCFGDVNSLDWLGSISIREQFLSELLHELGSTMLSHIDDAFSDAINPWGIATSVGKDCLQPSV
jgi:hypothetical protein